MITYGAAKSVLSKYAGTSGKCPDTASVDLFVRMILEYLLIHGTYGNERKFQFYAENGTITLPKELEVPLKVKIDGAVGSVWNRWFEYHSGNMLDRECIKSDALLEDPNLYPTVYDLPSCGGYPAVMGTCKEADDAHVIVKGVDVTGREIYTTHQGERIVGVKLSVCKNVIKTSPVLFGKITGVYKTETKGYVNMLSLDESGCSRKFLSDYGPYETTPAYRRVRFLIPDCPPVCKVTVLGRIRLKDKYADDDLIPFDNLYILSTAGQTVNSMHNDDVQTAITKDGYTQKLIETEGNYKKVNNGQPLEMFRPLSGGAIRNAGRTIRRVLRGAYGKW